MKKMRKLYVVLFYECGILDVMFIWTSNSRIAANYALEKRGDISIVAVAKVDTDWL